MNTRNNIKLISLMIAAIMVFGLISLIGLTVFAADSTEITEIKSTMAKERVPRPGMEISVFMPTVPDGEPYSRPWNGTSWYDEQGVLIAPSLNLFFDLGYEFEAGRTYYADYKYSADIGYTFSEKPTITLTGPDPSMFTYKIVERSGDGKSVTVRFTFTIPGERDYPDINKVSLVYLGMEAEGSKKPDPCELIYNNCTLTREEWNTGTWGSECDWTLNEENEKRFKAGRTYVHMIELTANNGYHFSEDLLAQKGRQKYEQYGEVTLSNDRSVATITFTYPIAEIEYIDVVNLEAKAGAENFYLARQGANMSGGLPFTTTYHYADAPYKEDNYHKWVDVETGEELYHGIEDMVFELGKKYRLHFYVDIKDEYADTIRFSNNTKLNLNYYAPGLSDYVEVETYTGDGSRTMSVYITYTIQPKPGEGSNASNPVICYNYNEFKYAMENDDIRYVALGDINERLPEGEGGLVTAIHVNGIKNLTLLGDATFIARAGINTTYAALLHVEQNDTLNISGAGSLTFKAVANNSYNAVIYNQGGSINISGGMLIGSYNTAVYGKAIWQDSGELRISGGEFFADNALTPLSQPRVINAVYIGGGQAWIQGGTFRTRNWITTIDLPYGLEIASSATVELSGGTFYGIKLPKSTTPLANYMDEDMYTPLSGDSKFNPNSTYSQEYTSSGKVVRIAWLIDHVDVHINTPVAGVDIIENYFNIPTSGCQVTMYYPQWYKNGELVTYGTFEAGANYKVVVQIEVKPGYGAEFTTGLTAAINNKSVTVDRNSAHWIEIEYDFGECPNIVPLIELTATAPKEGNKPSYTIGLGSNAYKLVGNYNNYKDYRTWYASNSGAAGTWTEMSDTDKFIAGKYYKFVVDIQTASGYEFSVYDDGSRIMPDVSATVNGYYAKVIKAYEQDPSTYITIEYNFGECYDSVIEKITVVDVVAPVAGQHPTYTYNILGTGYKMNTAKNAYYDAYWLNPAEKWYYIKNGIGWYDVTKDDWVYEHETFIPGHEYRVTVYLMTEDGYEFKHDKWYELQISATLNGKNADFVPGGSDWISNQKITYTFTCAQKDVTTILIYDLDEPNSGKAPDTNITVAYPELYTVKSVRWLDEEDGVVTSFEQGRLYTVEIIIQSAKFSGSDATIFANDMTAYIDGTKVEGWSNKVIKNNDNTVTVRYSFRKPAQAPEIEVYAFTTQPKGGELEPGISLAVSWQTNFVPQRFVAQMWDGNTWILWLEQFVDENSSRYEFYSPTENTYRLRIVAYIGNEIVATSNEFVITWTAPAPEYLYLYYPGEASGSPDFDIVLAGTEITLAECMFSAPEGKRFKAWAVGSIGGTQKKPGDKITINAETYIYAIWEDIPHTCYGVKQSEQKATCTVDGWKEYYKCQCGKYYEDVTCTKGIPNLSSWKVGAGKIAASGHKDLSPKDHKCDVCGANVGTHAAAAGKHTCDYCGKTVTECADANKDHKCDTCGASMGSHAAAVGKHTCDYCGKTVTECADANKDHKCDTCGASMGSHAAAVGKHTCDYCGKTVTECADKNSDGKCDVCGKNIGDCVDANKDHKCDKHGEDMGVHESALGKHTCDYCGAKITDCADANKDHKCDTCGTAMGTHTAASGKHTCDYCGAVVTNCGDANKDHKCDTCGASMGNHDAALGKHTCDYCGTKLTDCADVNKDHKCDVCGTVMTNCSDTNNDGKCDVCGTNIGTETEPAETTTKETEPAQTVTNETEPALTTSKETEPSETTTDETVPEQTSAQVTETEETKSPETEANTTEIHQDDGCGATLSPVGIILLFALGSVGFVIFKKKELRN